MEPLLFRMKHQEVAVRWMRSALFFKTNKSCGARSLLKRKEFYDSQGALKEGSEECRSGVLVMLTICFSWEGEETLTWNIC